VLAGYGSEPKLDLGLSTRIALLFVAVPSYYGGCCVVSLLPCSSTLSHSAYGPYKAAHLREIQV